MFFVYDLCVLAETGLECRP